MRLPEGRTPTECHKRAGTELFRLYLLAHRCDSRFAVLLITDRRLRQNFLVTSLYYGITEKIGHQTPTINRRVIAVS